jgi:hypothetical protein
VPYKRLWIGLAAAIRTGGMRVKVAGGTDLTALISGQDDMGWGAPGACA